MQIGKKTKRQNKDQNTGQKVGKRDLIEEKMIENGCKLEKRPKDRIKTKRRDKNEKTGQRPKDRTKAKRQVKRTTNRKATSMTVAELTVKNLDY